MRVLAIGLSTALLPTLWAAESAPNACEWELNRMHHVSVASERHLLYGDADLAAFLQSLVAGPCAPSVVPVFSDEPFVLTQGHRVLVSTGFIGQAGTEGELRAAIRKAAGATRPGARKTPCGAPSLRQLCTAWPKPRSFAAIQAKLAEDVLRYRRLTTPVLLTREQRDAANLAVLQ